MYNFLSRFILDKTSIKETSELTVNFIVDKCKNKEEIKDFNQYIGSHLEAVIPLKTKLYITHESSDQNFCLQAVDLFCWGIARKHNHNDTEWYDYYKSRIIYDEIYLNEYKYW